MTLLRRGFKTWCESAAAKYRRDLKIETGGRLDPRLLAKSEGVEIWTPDQIAGLDPQVVHQLLVADPDSWSAVTLTLVGSCVIITNCSHSIPRQNNSLAHELAHIILKHEPAKAFVTPDGMMMMNFYNPAHEEEATCLAGALLVPRAGLLRLLSTGQSEDQIAGHFEVSGDLVRMRKNVTGVARQLRSRRRGR